MVLEVGDYLLNVGALSGVTTKALRGSPVEVEFEIQGNRHRQGIRGWRLEGNPKPSDPTVPPTDQVLVLCVGELDEHYSTGEADE